MKLFDRKAGNKTINYNGKNVKFVNCVAEVEDNFGKEVLKLGIPDLYEHGKQPVFETPKEVQMKSDFKDREEWYKKEIARLTNINTANKKKIEELEQEVENWKNEYNPIRRTAKRLLSGEPLTDGRPLSDLIELDEHTRKCLAFEATLTDRQIDMLQELGYLPATTRQYGEECANCPYTLDEREHGVCRRCDVFKK